MIECPRCGFSQPKDQFCANCGVDMDHFVVKRPPLWLRLVQNPNLHLSLIGILIVLVIGYMVYTRSESVSREVNRLLDMPVSSRDAGDPDDERNRANFLALSAATNRGSRANNDNAESPTGGTPTAAATAGSDATKAATDDESGALVLNKNNKVEVSHWEVPREVVANVIALADRVGDGNAGRAYFFANGAKIVEQIQNVSQRLSLGRVIAARAGEQMTSETPPTTGEAFQFGFFAAITRVEGKDLGLKWESQLVMPQAETAAEAASSSPSVRSLVQTNMNGQATLTTAALLLVVMEPPNRSPREELIMRAGEGPWTVFASPEYRGGVTEWLIAVQLK